MRPLKRRPTPAWPRSTLRSTQVPRRVLRAVVRRRPRPDTPRVPSASATATRRARPVARAFAAPTASATAASASRSAARTINRAPPVAGAPARVSTTDSTASSPAQGFRFPRARRRIHAPQTPASAPPR
jgi:hypothetical protein